MNSLSAFLNPVKVENKEIIISERFKEDGKPVPFIIRPIMQHENEEIMRRHTHKDKKGNESYDQIAYVQDLTASAVVFPDLENAELQKAYGVLGAAKLLKKMLLIGEFTDLSAAVTKLSGLDADINDDIEAVKN